MSSIAQPRSSCSANLCPLCEGPNRCALEAARAEGEAATACWCTRVRFAPELLERVPLSARGVACICESCATAGTGTDTGAGAAG